MFCVGGAKDMSLPYESSKELRKRKRGFQGSILSLRSASENRENQSLCMDSFVREFLRISFILSTFPNDCGH